MLLGLSSRRRKALNWRACASDVARVQRLTEIEYVTINLPGGRDFDAHVVAVAGTTAALKPIGFVIAKLPSRIDDVLISFVYGTQLVGLKGLLVRDARILRFVVADGVQKRGRRSTRIPAELAITLDGTPGTTINIATEGVLVRCDKAVETGDVLQVELQLPGGPLSARGRVVRHAEGLIALELHRDAHVTVGEFVIAEKLRAQPV
jgi:PilZ domain-containing protein